MSQRKVELLCGAHSDFELKAMDVASLSRTAVHKYNTSLSGFDALFLTFRLCEQHGLGVNAMSDLVTLIGSIMGDGIRQEWWPTSCAQVEKLLGFPDFKREAYTIHHFCPVCECRFNYLQPHQYTLASAQVCRQPDCNGKRFRTEGASLVASQLLQEAGENFREAGRKP